MEHRAALAALALATLPAWRRGRGLRGRPASPRAQPASRQRHSRSPPSPSTRSRPGSGIRALRADNGMRLRLGYQVFALLLGRERVHRLRPRARRHLREPRQPRLGVPQHRLRRRAPSRRFPVWRSFSFYGRLGAYHGDVRNAFALVLDLAPGRRRARHALALRPGRSLRLLAAPSASTPTSSATRRSARRWASPRPTSSRSA